MSIDLSHESVLPLSRASKVIPPLRGNRQIHVATVYRWAQRGLRGVKLETIRVGGTLCTSVEAIQRFCDQLTCNTAAEKFGTREPVGGGSRLAGELLTEQGI